jgi:hypothetical protein
MNRWDKRERSESNNCNCDSAGTNDGCIVLLNGDVTERVRMQAIFDRIGKRVARKEQLLLDEMWGYES